MADETTPQDPQPAGSQTMIRKGRKTATGAHALHSAVEQPGRRKIRKVLSYIFLSVFAIFMIYPFAFMVATSLKGDKEVNEISENPLKPIFWMIDFPQGLKAVILHPIAAAQKPSEYVKFRKMHFENYARVFAKDERSGDRPFLRFYINTIFVSLVVTVGQVGTSALAAYAFARLQWPGRDLLFLAYLATLMIPFVVTMIPNYILLSKMPEWCTQVFGTDYFTTYLYAPGFPSIPLGRALGIDSYFALTIPCMFTASGTFLLRQFFMTLPKDLEEAAKIDGCGLWRIFTNVILPLSKPALSTITIFTFMAIWGSFLWPLIVTNSEFLKVLPVGLNSYKGLHTTEWNLLMTASILMIIPMILVFLVGQRYFISGITMGAVKG